MTVTAHRARRRPRARTVRMGLAVAAVATVLPTAACGLNAQTLRPYTPAEGVNFDVGDLNQPDSVIHVRNLLVISRSPGSGIVSASMSMRGTDTLTGVSGTPYAADGATGTAWTASLSGPVLLTNNNQVVLTNQQPFVTISGATGLQAGLDTEITLEFGKAGTYTTRTTVVDGTRPPYSDVTASASPSASASPTLTAEPSPSATPS